MRTTVLGLLSISALHGAVSLTQWDRESGDKVVLGDIDIWKPIYISHLKPIFRIYLFALF